MSYTRTTKKLLRISLLLFLVFATTNFKKDTSKDLEEFLKKIDNSDFSGTILISHKGKTLHHQAYGLSDKKQNQLNHKNTIFDIGSITKQFTGAAILKLEMEGKLSVEDPISKYFENVPNDKRAITIHQLLTHSSGLVDVIGDDYEEISETGFLNEVFSTKLSYPSGTRHEYSNVGYSLLTILIEKISEMGYEAYLHRALFTPAQMLNTGYVLPKWAPKNIAKGYRKDKEYGRPNEQNWDTGGPYLNLKGNGGILSNVEDLLKWHEALLGDEILNESAKKKYFTPHIEEYPDGNSFYGYGWVIMPTSMNQTAIWHNGGNGIFFADFWRFQEENLAVIVLTNNQRGEKDEIIAGQISKLILGK